MGAAAPDILVIMTDQQSATAMSCAGNPEVSTPALDSLARDGIRFTHAYCTSPLCAPSRASMITGMLPSQLGMEDNGVSAPDDFPTSESLGQIFSRSGYDCVYAGKWHVPGITHEGQGGAPGATSGFRELFSGTHEGLAGACADHLRTRDGTTPLLMVASFNEPHGICEWARGQAPPSGELEDPDWRDLPLLPPNFARGAEEPEALRLVQDFAWMVHPTKNWSPEQWRRYRYAYFRLCERVDAQIQLLLDAWRSTIDPAESLIVMTADHGDMQGAHQWNQKKQLYEEASGVPFIVVPPARERPRRGGSVSEELVSTGLDLLPTLCDWAEIPAPPHCAGRSIRSGSPARDSVVVETVWQFPGLVPPPATGRLEGRSVHHGDLKYSCFAWGQHREQLVNLRSDPGELTNLTTSGAHQGELSALRELLRSHCASVQDRFARFVPTSANPR